MPCEDALDLGRVHVLATGHDHVLDPVEDEQVAVLVQTAHVARPEEPVLGERRLRRLAALPVAGRDAGAADDDLARPTRLDQPTRDGVADLQLDPVTARPAEPSRRRSPSSRC